MKSTEAASTFAKALGQLARSYSLWDVFNDFLDYALLMLKWWDLKPFNFQELEKKYPTRDQQELFAKAYLAMADVADSDGVGFKDPFGDYFMEHLCNSRLGQTFTPEEVCKLQVALCIDKIMKEDAKIYDPACGSGRILLAAAKRNRNATFHAADIDLTCCKMTLINFLLNTMCGEVAWMDSLAMKHWKSWHISKAMNGNGYYLPYYTESGPGETHFKQTAAPSSSDSSSMNTPIHSHTKKQKKWNRQQNQMTLQFD